MMSNMDSQLRNALASAGVATPASPAADSPELTALGKALFFDKILSGNSNISCATCHNPTAGLGDNLPLSIGEGGSGASGARILASGATTARNAQHVFNTGLTGRHVMFWDGRVARDPATGALRTPEPGLNGPSPALANIAQEIDSALAAQALFPLVSTVEMMGTGNDVALAGGNAAAWAKIMERLVGSANGTIGGIAEYRTLFRAAYPAVTNYDDFNIGHAARAIAAYQRTLSGTNSPLDRFIAGDNSALTAQQKRGGMMFFNMAGCGACHNGPHLTDDRFHVVANPQLLSSGSDDLGRYSVTLDPNDMYKFKTATLRNVEYNAPYTHSGAYATLEAVVAHYSNPARALDNYDPTQLRADYAALVDADPARKAARLSALDQRLAAPLNLQSGQIQDIVAFLRALSDPALADLSSETPLQSPSGLPVGD